MTLIEALEKAKSLGIKVNMNDEEIKKMENRQDSIFWKSSDYGDNALIQKLDEKEENGLILCVNGDINITFKDENNEEEEYRNEEVQSFLFAKGINDESLSKMEDEEKIKFEHNNWFAIYKIRNNQHIETIDTSSNLTEAIKMFSDLIIETLSEEEVKNYEEENKGEHKTDLNVIEIDETEHWDKEFLKEHKIKKISMVYLFDKNIHTFCAEMVYSYWLVPLYFNVDADIQDADSIVDSNTTSDYWDGGYYNHSDIDSKELKKVNNDFNYITKEKYDEKLEKVKENLHSNRIL